MPKIFKGDFVPEWDHLCPRFKDEFSSKRDHLYLGPSLPCDTYSGACYHPRGMGHMCPRFYGGDFLHPVAWDNLCTKRKILHERKHYYGEVILPVSSLNF